MIQINYLDMMRKLACVRFGVYEFQFGTVIVWGYCLPSFHHAP